jgi:hypothetical protein
MIILDERNVKTEEELTLIIIIHSFNGNNILILNSLVLLVISIYCKR